MLITIILMSLLQLLKAEGEGEQKPILLYVGDPMCSWCYGFAPELNKLRVHYEGAINFELVVGGLRPYNDKVMDDKLRDFLKDHWEEIGEKTGQKFNFDVLKWEDFKYDTEPACRAVVVARFMKPEITFEFFEATQNSFYADNNQPDEAETYMELAEKFGLNRRDFWEKFSSEEYQNLTKQDFQISRQLGIQGFPSTAMRINGKWYNLSRGYRKFEELRGLAEKTMVLAEEEKEEQEND